jgi:hypothetical protein
VEKVLVPVAPTLPPAAINCEVPREKSPPV